MGIVALFRTISDDYGYVDPDSLDEWLGANAPVSGPYHRLTSSIKISIKAFSCQLAEAVMNPQNEFASGLCRIAVI